MKQKLSNDYLLQLRINQDEERKTTANLMIKTTQR